MRKFVTMTAMIALAAGAAGGICRQIEMTVTRHIRRGSGDGTVLDTANFLMCRLRKPWQDVIFTK